MLLTVLQSFVHDPLVEWIVEQRNQQQRQLRSNAGKQAQAQPQRADFGAVIKSSQAIALIDMRLSGKIVTNKVSVLLPVSVCVYRLYISDTQGVGRAFVGNERRRSGGRADQAGHRRTQSR